MLYIYIELNKDMRISYKGFLYESIERSNTIEVDGKTRPIINSLGEQIHNTPEGIIAFWKWFGDSKAVDEKGNPLVVYHGDSEDFDEFIHPWDREDYEESFEDYDIPNLGVGFYFTPTESYAKRFGKTKAYYLKINNLLDLSDESIFNKVIEYSNEYDDEDYRLTPQDIDNYMLKNRYDGVMAIGVGGLSYGASEFKITTGNQAKLVNNSGTFDSSYNIATENINF